LIIMESFFGRYRNALVLVAVVFVQIIALATQVKRPSDPKIPGSPSTRLIRVWTVTAFAPFERAFMGTGHFFRTGWHDYIDLHGVRKQNQELQAEVTRLRIEEVHLKQDAEQAHRLQALFGFREKFISQTMAAQVIGTSGNEQSRVIYIDKDVKNGIKTDMAVITPDGIVGKVKDVFPLSSQVLMINDRDSGAGVILEKSRLQGVLRGSITGELTIDGIMADQNVEVGEHIVTSGGDRIYPKGLPVGIVSSVATDRETGTFLSIKIKPAADLNRLEEVLVVTKMAEDVSVETAGQTPMRAADILAERLPTVPKTSPQPPVASGADVVEDKKKLKTTIKANGPRGNQHDEQGIVPDPAAKDTPKKPLVQPGGMMNQKVAPQGTTEKSPVEEKKTFTPASPQPPAKTTENPPR
jgi:rod shape-determining protein MreC